MFKFNRNANLTKFMTVSASALMLLGIGAPAISANTTNVHATSNYVPASLSKIVAKQDAEADDANDGKVGDAGPSKVHNTKYMTLDGHTYRTFTEKQIENHQVHVSHGHAYLVPRKSTARKHVAKKHVARKHVAKKANHLNATKRQVAKKLANKKNAKKRVVNRKVNSHKIAKHFARKHLAKKAKKSTKAERIQKQINALNRELKKISREVANLNREVNNK